MGLAKEGEGRIDEKYVENVIKDGRFRAIVEDCLIDCYEDCYENCYDKCLKKCLKVAWVLYHAWYAEATSPTASAA